MSEHGNITRRTDNARAMWQRYPIRTLDQLENAVLGAELDPILFGDDAPRGSLVFSAYRGVVFSSGLIEGRVALRGAMPPDAITIFVGLRMGSGSRCGLTPLQDGSVGVLGAGERCDTLLTSGTLYLAATLSRDALEALLLEQRVSRARSTGHELIDLKACVCALHRSKEARLDPECQTGFAILEWALAHRASSAERSPCAGDGKRNRTLRQALAYIEQNLSGTISLDGIAGAAQTSRRTLHRTFIEAYGETPLQHIRRLRLHRIRRALINCESTDTSVREVAHRYGIHEPGRMAGWYKRMFGVLPHETIVTLRQADERSRFF